MAARKKPTRPLVKTLTELTHQLNSPEFEPPEGTSLIDYIRAHLIDQDIMCFVDVRDHQLLDSEDGSSWAAVDIKLTMIEAMSGDEVSMSYVGQASDPGMNAYDRAFDEAVKRCLIKTLVYRPVALDDAPVIQAASEIHEEAHEDAPEDIPEVKEDPIEEVTEIITQEAPEVLPEPVKPEVHTPEEVEKIVEEEDADDARPNDEQHESMDQAEEEDASEEAEEVEASDEETSDEEISDEEVSAASVEEAARVEDRLEESVEAAAESDAQEDLTQEDEDQVVAAQHTVNGVDFAGFSEHPLWIEYWEVLSGEMEANGHELVDFVDRLTKARKVDHLYWLSPEQLQSEVDHLDQLQDQAAYFDNPGRDIEQPSDLFMHALQSVTDGESAKLFRDLYLERMGANLLTDVDGKKLSLMVNKLNKYNPQERADYIDEVLRTEA